MAAITVDKSVNVDNAYSMSGGSPCFVALQSGAAAYQTTLTGYSNWATAATVTPTTSWSSICYGNNLIVAVSSTFGNISSSSPTGATATWTQHQLPIYATWYGVAYGNSIYVAISSGLGSATNAVATSPDGSFWTSANATVSGNWQALCYGDKFMAVNNGATDSMFSTNGTSWTIGGALPASRAWSSVCYGTPTVNSVVTPTYVAVATGASKGAYSTNGGVSWAEMTMPGSATNWKSVTYGNGTFVAVSNTSGTIAAYSTDGINWFSSTLPATATWVGVAYGNGVFSAIASGSTTAGFSYDGKGWQSITSTS